MFIPKFLSIKLQHDVGTVLSAYYSTPSVSYGCYQWVRDQLHHVLITVASACKFSHVWVCVVASIVACRSIP